jgi:hypothetical protein
MANSDPDHPLSSRVAAPLNADGVADLGLEAFVAVPVAVLVVVPLPPWKLVLVRVSRERQGLCIYNLSSTTCGTGRLTGYNGEGLIITVD